MGLGWQDLELETLAGKETLVGISGGGQGVAAQTAGGRAFHAAGTGSAKALRLEYI